MRRRRLGLSALSGVGCKEEAEEAGEVQRYESAQRRDLVESWPISDVEGRTDQTKREYISVSTQVLFFVQYLMRYCPFSIIT